MANVTLLSTPLTIGNDLKTYLDDGRSRGPAQCHHLREAMGLNRGKLPEGFIPAQAVGDTWVYVLARKDAEEKYPNSTRPHRMYAICNHCGEHFPTGRFGQHLKVHKEVR